MRILNVALTVILINLLGACASKDSMLPVPEKDMKTVYDQHMQSAGGTTNVYDDRSVLRRPMVEPDVELSEYVRTEKNQLQAKFKTIPNPTLYMFVAPHLASETQVPIPGYLTEFKMWEKTHYALPGEVSDLDPNF